MHTTLPTALHPAAALSTDRSRLGTEDRGRCGSVAAPLRHRCGCVAAAWRLRCGSVAAALRDAPCCACRRGKLGGGVLKLERAQRVVPRQAIVQPRRAQPLRLSAWHVHGMRMACTWHVACVLGEYDLVDGMCMACVLGVGRWQVPKLALGLREGWYLARP